MLSLTAAELRAFADYVPATGHFIAGGQRVDEIRSDGYRVVRINGVAWLAHRLAFLWMLGHWPISCADHIDLDRSNNRWSNLRAATRRQNQQNHGMSVRNTSGVKGVSWVASRNRWVAQLSINGRTKNLGRYVHKYQAEAVVIAARIKHHGEFANHGCN